MVEEENKQNGPWQEFVYEDLEYAVRMARGYNGAFVTFQVFSLINGDCTPTYRKYPEIPFDITESMDEAAWEFEGSVRFDSCANIDFDSCLHLCKPEDMDILAKLIHRIYENAEKLIEFV